MGKYNSLVGVELRWVQDPGSSPQSSSRLSDKHLTQKIKQSPYIKSSTKQNEMTHINFLKEKKGGSC